MDPKITLTPTLRIDRITSQQGTGQWKQPAFARGQMIQGLVTGKNSANQFYLDIGDNRFVADSKAPLQVGQQLELQVTRTHPRITLQIVEDSLIKDIGKSLHLLTGQEKVLSEIATLAENTADSPRISSQSKQVLRFFAQAPEDPALPQAPRTAAGKSLVNQVHQLLTAADPAETGEALAEIRNILGRLRESGTMQAETAALAERILRELPTEQSTLSTLFLQQAAGAGEEDGVSVASIRTLLGSLRQVSTNTAAINRIEGQLMQLFPDGGEVLRPGRLMQLLDLTLQLAPRSESAAASLPVRPSGENIRQLVDRLGINLEQMLADGRKEEAVQTLKSALLEISHSMTGNEQVRGQSEHLLSTIELYQMLQVRLSQEGLFFLPLPLPSQEQGYLLVENNEQKDSGKQGGENGETTYQLHLQLEGLGNVQVDIRQRGNTVALRFLAQDAERAGFMAENREELQEWLTAARLETVSFLTGADDPVKNLLQKMITQDKTGVLDTRA